MPLLALLATITNLAGVVTFEREGLDFVFIADDAGSSWRVEKADGEKPPVVMGDRIAVRGEIEPSVKRRLVASQVTKDGTGAVPPPRVATIADIFNEDDEEGFRNAQYIRTPWNLVDVRANEPLNMDMPKENKGADEHHIKQKMPSIKDLM